MPRLPQALSQHLGAALPGAVWRGQAWSWHAETLRQLPRGGSVIDKDKGKVVTLYWIVGLVSIDPLIQLKRGCEKNKL